MMRNILIQGAQSLGLELTDDIAEIFRRYYVFLEESNKAINLTAITGEKDVAELHFLDSLALQTLVSFKDKSIIDIGSGAGFPGVPLKIAVPSIRLTLLDAQQKRINFLKDLCARLRIHDVVCLHARAEEVALLPDMRDQFDSAVSRAVARLNVLAEICLPFVKTGGTFIAMKGTDSDDEIKEAESAFDALGAALAQVVDYEIPGTGIWHRAVVIRKTSATPAGFPRRYAKIEKKPL